MNVLGFLENFEITSYVDPKQDLWRKVVVQSLRHTTRSDMVELQGALRPNEEKVYADWRKNNLRHVTVGFTLQYQRMVKRTLMQSVTVDSKYEKVKQRYFNNELPLSIQDPNSVTTWIPYVGGNEEIIPDNAPSDKRFTKNMAIKTHEITVLSKNIVKNGDGVLIYALDKVDVPTQAGGNESKIRYIGVDRDAYYLIYPIYQDKKFKYVALQWYVHELNYIPYAPLLGINIVEQENRYKESMCWAAFGWFDQGITTFSSAQVAIVKAANPKTIINAEIDCPTCGGVKFVGDLDEHGMIKEGSKKVCGSCKGKGTLYRITDFTEIKLNGKGFNGDKVSSNPIYYLEPPKGLKDLVDLFMIFFDKGEAQLMYDPLGDTGNESGVAKYLRLEPKQDAIQDIGAQLCNSIQLMINTKGLLERTIKEDELIHVVPPAYYETKSPEMMKSTAMDSALGERFRKWMKAIEAENRGNEFEIKLQKYSYLYAPLIIYTDDEFTTAFNTGQYTERDAIRRDFANYAIEKILRVNPNLEDVKEIRQKADELLIKEGILREIKENGNADESGRSKLLDTVGGADAAIKINKAVAAKEMTEVAAEKLLAKFFKISIEEARELISIPPQTIE